MSAVRQAVVLCGGRGTRLASVLGDRPKVLADVGGRPLLAHLLRDLARHGVREVLLLAGYGGDQVRAAAPPLTPPSVDLRILCEPEPRGTAGALALVEDALAERFFLAYGDIFTALDWSRLGTHAARCGGLATLLVHRTSHPQDSDVVSLDDRHRLVGWLGRGARRDASAAAGSCALTNAGVGVFHRDVLRWIPRDRPCDLTAELLPARVDHRAPLHGYLSCEYARDIGTPERLRAVDADVRAGRHHLRAETVLLDRDGVLVAERGGLTQPADVRLVPGAVEGLRRLAEAGVRTAIVTNQAVLARGRCTEDTLAEIQGEIERRLAEAGVAAPPVFRCPHHPETHHGEGRPELRGPCGCRKPSTGLVGAALAATAAAPWRALLVGDASIDMQTALNAGLPGLAVDTGKAASDGEFPAGPVWRFPDLATAAAWIVGGEEHA